MIGRPLLADTANGPPPHDRKTRALLPPLHLSTPYLRNFHWACVKFAPDAKQLSPRAMLPLLIEVAWCEHMDSGPPSSTRTRLSRPLIEAWPCRCARARPFNSTQRRAPIEVNPGGSFAQIVQAILHLFIDRLTRFDFDGTEWS
jgi:hypothetical protein